MYELITKEEKDFNVLLKGSIFLLGMRQKERRSLYFLNRQTDSRLYDGPKERFLLGGGRKKRYFYACRHVYIIIADSEKKHPSVHI